MTNLPMDADNTHFPDFGILNWWPSDELAVHIRRNIIHFLSMAPKMQAEKGEEEEDDSFAGLGDLFGAETEGEDVTYAKWFRANVRVSLPRLSDDGNTYTATIVLYLENYYLDMPWLGHGNPIRHDKWEKLFTEQVSDLTLHEVIDWGEEEWRIPKIATPQKHTRRWIMWEVQIDKYEGFEGLGSLFGAEKGVNR